MEKMTSTDLNPRLSVIIPTRNNERDLSDCLISIMNLDYDLEKIEIVIWDNDSQPEGKKKIKKHLSEMSGKNLTKVEFVEAGRISRNARPEAIRASGLHVN